MEIGFDIEKYLVHSRKVDIADLDLSSVQRYPLSDSEIRCLTYMMDVESHTIVFLKGILSTCAITDPETTAFLSCWAYEEFFHGRTIRQFLQSAGIEFSPTRFSDIQKQATFREWIEGVGASLLCHLTRHFHAVYLTWGAISSCSWKDLARTFRTFMQMAKGSLEGPPARRRPPLPHDHTGEHEMEKQHLLRFWPWNRAPSGAVHELDEVEF